MRGDIHEPIKRLEDDLLGRRAIAEIILRKLASEDCPPAVGIYGGWGTGKSSVVKLLELLNNEPANDFGLRLHIKCIDAWRYAATGNLFVPVIVYLMELVRQGGIVSSDVKACAERMVRVTTLALTDIALRVVTKVLTSEKLTLEDVEFYKDEVEDSINTLDWETVADEIEKTRRAFNRVVERVLQGRP